MKIFKLYPILFTISVFSNFSLFGQNVGIGTSFPIYKLDVVTTNNNFGIVHRSFEGNILATRIGGTSAGIGTYSFTNMRIFSNSLPAIFISAENQYVGIATENPTNFLQIGNGNPAYVGNALSIGNGAQGMVFNQNVSGSLWQSNTNMVINPKNGTGNMGINANNPVNRLEIGSLGPHGFNGNDIAIGNGTNAMVVYQSNASLSVTSTTDIVLMPRNNAQGNVGINTSVPRYPLHVSGSASGNEVFCFAFFAKLGDVCQENIGVGSRGNIPISIYATHRVLANEFNAFSDARIKNVIGISTGRTDLETINAIQITDYTLKDQINHGNKRYKKVIAQQVESVYPQVVSKQTDFIPNVYQVASTIENTSTGVKIAFANQHNIHPMAKRLRVLVDGQPNFMEVDILSITSGREVVVNMQSTQSKKIFVYGEEVNDFRTVDYEGLTTLNISATQELSSIVKKQQQAIEMLQNEIEKLKNVVKN